jgi:methylenetetrahydrofolate reductase (NADPH)
MTAVEDAGLIERVFILIGVGPLRSAKAAEWMRSNVPGVHIPDAVIARLSGAADQAREGRNLCVDLLQEIHSIKGVSGAHIMAYRQEESVAEVIERSGVLAGRRPWYPGRDQHDQSDRKAS